MTHVETLRILLPVVYNPYCGYMVDDLPSLGVEQVAPAIVAPVAANIATDGIMLNKKGHYAGKLSHTFSKTGMLRILKYTSAYP